MAGCQLLLLASGRMPKEELQKLVGASASFAAVLREYPCGESNLALNSKLFLDKISHNH